MNYKEIIDISIPLTEKTIVYPGNPNVKIVEKAGKSSVHSEISFGSHTGTHVDAQKHVFPDGKALDEIPLVSFVGKARVLDMTDVKESISIEDVKRFNVKAGERILVKTQNSLVGFETFRDDYIYLSGDAADYLASLPIALFGIDYLSIKKRGGSDNRPHTSLLSKNIPIFEGLNLKEAEPGEYFFVGLPLHFPGLDGSPARAILLK